ncbi:MAG TPA: UDP-2,3-diacylglucosamine diphosphatase LpxI [Pseudolabrys sp.]|nr:UDP-2,3-diacylglucosamine diphosphatase LpxI [Pseudolabrys sp.]
MNPDLVETRGPLAIVCGGGVLPFAVADAVRSRGQEVVLFAIKGAADAARVKSYPHHWIGIGDAGKLYAGLRKEGCRDITFIGSVTRPSIKHIRVSLRTLLMLPRILSGFRGGDDHLLSKLGRVVANYGFHVVAPHEAAPEILIGEGDLTVRKPSSSDQADIARGFDLLRAVGPYDVGQAAVVVNQHVLAVEGIEGTDAMLARIAELRRQGRVNTAVGVGVLVKTAKPGQDRRFDLPAIGPQTIAGLELAGLGGIAVSAGEAVIAEPAEMVRAADAAHIFVTAVKARQ